MQKHPKIINMSLNALKDPSKPSQHTKGDRSTDNSGKTKEVREEVAIQDLITFINLTVEQKNKIKNQRKKEVRLLKQLESTIKKTEKEEMIAIPLDVAETVQGILRKYLMRKMEERQEQLRNYASKGKLTHDRSGNIRAFLYRNHKENSQGNHQQEDNEAGLFRSIAAEKMDRERLITRNEELQSELVTLRQKLKEKNNLISKLLSKETQLKRKYKDQFNRLVRNKNIYDISVNFQRDEEEGEGRNGLNVAGKHLLEGQKEQHEQIKMLSMLKNQKSATLFKSDSEYIKDRKPKFGKTRNKVYPFRNSKKNLNETCPATQFLRNINKSLPTQCISKRQHEASQFKENQYKEGAKTLIRQNPAKDEPTRRPTFQLYINQLQSNIVSKKLSVEMSEERNLQLIAKMKDEEFEALEMHGFYKDQNTKEIDKIYKH